ncbi:MAG: hypothetical protein AAGC93_03415 [Cyanobacteria bacterium P01_F01_bin.53]
MLNRGTLLLLMGAIVLGGGVLLLEHFQGENANQATQNASTAANNIAEGDGERLFSFPEEDIESFVVNRGTDTVSFEKQENETWEMTTPEPGIAEGGAIAFLLSQLTNPALKTLTIESGNELANFGLAEPNTTVDLVAAGKPYQVMLGDSDFSGDKRYVRVVDGRETTDSQAGSEGQNTDTPDPIKVHVVSGSIVNAVNRPTAEWLIATEENPSAENGSQTETTDNSETDAKTPP